MVRKMTICEGLYGQVSEEQKLLQCVLELTYAFAGC